MNLKEYKSKIDNEIVEPLIEFRNEDEDCGFCTRHVMTLRKLLFKYLTKLSKLKAPTDEQILKLVEKLILSINKLNKQADYCMLEADEGDIVCEIIQAAAIEAGLTETDEDITAEWREEW